MTAGTSRRLDTWTNPLRDPRDKRLPRIAGPSSLVIFGVTGDLSRKKLMPAVYDLANRGLLPPGFSLVGFGRRNWTAACSSRWSAAAAAPTASLTSVWACTTCYARFWTSDPMRAW